MNRYFRKRESLEIFVYLHDFQLIKLASINTSYYDYRTLSIENVNQGIIESHGAVLTERSNLSTTFLLYIKIIYVMNTISLREVPDPNFVTKIYISHV